MLQHQGKEVRDLAKRLSTMVRPTLALARMIQILKSDDLRGYPRIGHYVPNVGFLFPSVVPGPEFVTVELTAPVHRMLLDMMVHPNFTVIRHAPFTRVVGVLQKVIPIASEGTSQLSTLTINCEPVILLNVNLD